MRLCSDDHGEVCYEGYTCPACELVNQTEALKEDIAGLKNEIDDLNGTVHSLESEIESLESK